MDSFQLCAVGCHQLHVNILPLLPDFPLLYFLAALRQEGAVSGTFVRAKGLCQFKVMISNDGVGPETVGYDALVPQPEMPLR